MEIMFVSDNATLSPEIEEQLQRCGIAEDQVVVCSLNEATDRAVQGCPDVILLHIPPETNRALKLLEEMAPVVPASRILCLGPANDPRLILRVLKEGAVQYIDESEIASELYDALRRLRRNPRVSADAGKIITVVGVSGGSGASTVAVNCATSLAHEHGMCALIDLDLETGDLAPLMNVQPHYSVADFARNVDRMDSLMFEQCFAIGRAEVVGR